MYKANGDVLRKVWSYQNGEAVNHRRTYNKMANKYDKRTNNDVRNTNLKV